MAYNRWLMHYGVKGMKWGVRKEEHKLANEYKVLSTLSGKEMQWYGEYVKDPNSKRETRRNQKYYAKLAKKYERKNAKDYSAMSIALKDTKANEVMGTILGGRHWDHARGEHVITIGIAVSKKYQGKHVTDRLVNEGKRWFDKHPEYAAMHWYAYEDNVRSRRTAEKHGFVRDPDNDEPGDVAYIYRRKQH